MNTAQFPPQYEIIVRLIKPFQPYLVGGAVRDLLLERRIHDLDFALPEGTVEAGRLLADHFQGDFFVLDQERATTRVILGRGEEPRLVVDFTRFQGESIEGDLASRDFTITSMALDVAGQGGVIDPFQGRVDLQGGLIRSTSERSLLDDPLRCLRAVRLAAQLEFTILPETKAQIRDAHPGLAAISAERIRDELFRMLAGPNQAAALRAAQALDLYSYLLPGELRDLAGRHLHQLELLWSLFTEPHDQERAGNWFKATLVHRLGRYRAQIKNYLEGELVPGRSVYQLSLLLPLLPSFGDESGQNVPGVLHSLALGNVEMDFLEKGVGAAADFISLSGGGEPPQPLEVYRFFRNWGEAGLSGIFLGLARNYGQQEPSRESWISKLDAARILLTGWWERRQEWVDPPHLLDGNDLLEEFQLRPGPQIGALLEQLREEQVRSGMERTDQALSYLSRILDENAGEGL